MIQSMAAILADFNSGPGSISTNATQGIGGTKKYSYSFSNFTGTYTIEKNGATGATVNTTQRSAPGTPVTATGIALANALASRDNGGGPVYHAGLGAGQTGPGYSIDSKTGKSPALTTAGLADAVINYVNIGPDIYATIGSPKPIPPSVQKKIRAGLVYLFSWRYSPHYRVIL
jgi:hypothetical protein